MEVLQDVSLETLLETSYFSPAATCAIELLLMQSGAFLKNTDLQMFIERVSPARRTFWKLQYAADSCRDNELGLTTLLHPPIEEMWASRSHRDEVISHLKRTLALKTPAIAHDDPSLCLQHRDAIAKYRDLLPFDFEMSLDETFLDNCLSTVHVCHQFATGKGGRSIDIGIHGTGTFTRTPLQFWEAKIHQAPNVFYQTMAYMREVCSETVIFHQKPVSTIALIVLPDRISAYVARLVSANEESKIESEHIQTIHLPNEPSSREQKNNTFRELVSLLVATQEASLLLGTVLNAAVESQACNPYLRPEPAGFLCRAGWQLTRHGSHVLHAWSSSLNISRAVKFYFYARRGITVDQQRVPSMYVFMNNAFDENYYTGLSLKNDAAGNVILHYNWIEGKHLFTSGRDMASFLLQVGHILSKNNVHGDIRSANIVVSTQQTEDCDAICKLLVHSVSA